MAEVIEVKTQDLRTTASQFDESAGKMHAAGKKMVALIDQFTSTVWMGEAKTKYAGKLKGMEDDIDRVKKNIGEYVTNLQTAASNYETTETSNVSLAGSLKTDVIK